MMLSLFGVLAMLLKKETNKSASSTSPHNMGIIIFCGCHCHDVEADCLNVLIIFSMGIQTCFDPNWFCMDFKVSIFG